MQLSRPCANPACIGPDSGDGPGVGPTLITAFQFTMLRGVKTCSTRLSLCLFLIWQVLCIPIATALDHGNGLPHVHIQNADEGHHHGDHYPVDHAHHPVEEVGHSHHVEHADHSDAKASSVNRSNDAGIIFQAHSHQPVPGSHQHGPLVQDNTSASRLRDGSTFVAALQAPPIFLPLLPRQSHNSTRFVLPNSTFLSASSRLRAPPCR